MASSTNSGRRPRRTELVSLPLSPVAQEFLAIHMTCLGGDRFQILQSLEERRRTLERRQDLQEPEVRLLLDTLGDYAKAVHLGILPMAAPPSPEQVLAGLRSSGVIA